MEHSLIQVRLSLAQCSTILLKLFLASESNASLEANKLEIYGNSSNTEYTMISIIRIAIFVEVKVSAEKLLLVCQSV